MIESVISKIPTTASLSEEGAQISAGQADGKLNPAANQAKLNDEVMEFLRHAEKMMALSETSPEIKQAGKDKPEPVAQGPIAALSDLGDTLHADLLKDFKKPSDVTLDDHTAVKGTSSADLEAMLKQFAQFEKPVNVATHSAPLGGPNNKPASPDLPGHNG